MKKFLVILFLVIVINCTSQFSWAAEISTAVTAQQTIDDNETLTITSDAGASVKANTNDLIDMRSTDGATLDNSGEIINTKV